MIYVLEVHIERMRPFLCDGISDEQLRDLAAADVEEQLVDCVKDHRGSCREDVEFKIHWKGFSDEDDSWEPLVNVNGNQQLQDYLATHSQAREVMSKATATGKKKKNKKSGKKN